MHRAEEGVVDEPPTLEAAEPSESEEDREIRRATAIFEAELASLHLNPDEVNEVDGVCDSDYEEGEEVESCESGSRTRRKVRRKMSMINNILEIFSNFCDFPEF
jgi:hypothetical protein